ncbi:MAG: serine/threonine protein kinase [Acidobacteriota bacterium]|nr:serine/threonine protein kinase [Acidobacteriota bacterium]
MQVGRYEILEIIGTGAYGRVVRAHDPMIGRPVAIKLLSPKFATGDTGLRFLQEARVVGQLSHPSIIALHDMGIEESSSTPYLVMELLTGESLDRIIIERGGVPFARACAWAAEVATALAVAHRKGVVHGDVKPANVLITEDGRIKLMDFGMSRLANSGSPESELFGTPAYWCPEQILGKPQDARSDIFSLGTVLYEMVTGHRPFEAETIQGICHRVVSSTPLPASHANPSVPEPFDQLIWRCLAKDPAGRYATGDELAADLYPFARRKPVPPRPSPSPRPLSLTSRAAKLLRSA